MAKKIYTVILVLSIVSLLNGIPDLAEGIRQRGFGGVNYGPVLVSLLIGGWAFIGIRTKR